MDFSRYGSWRPLDATKTMSEDVRTFSTIGDFILRTLFFSPFLDLPPPQWAQGPSGPGAHRAQVGPSGPRVQVGQGPSGPRAQVGPEPKWAQGPSGLGPGPKWARAQVGQGTALRGGAAIPRWRPTDNLRRSGELCQHRENPYRQAVWGIKEYVQI